MFFMSIYTDLLRFLVNDPDYEETAGQWFIAAIVVAVLTAGAVFGLKAIRKRIATIAANRIWTRGQTWLLVVSGIFPLFLILAGVWWLTRDFYNFLEIGGLMKGTLIAWVIYAFIMIVGHLVSPWRRELI